MKYFTWCLLFFACYLQAQSHTVTVDFTNRSGGYTIPGPMAGWNARNVNLGGGGAAIGGQIQDAQLWNQRYFLGVYSYCTTSGCGPTYNKPYTDVAKDKLDDDLNEVYRDVGPNARVTVTIFGTPQSTDSKCGYQGIPWDLTKWADLALQLVQHIDQQPYSSIVEAYEIENEPDGVGICWPTGYTEQQKLHDYKSIYAPAAAKIYSQIKTDGKKLGGPTLCCSQNALGWLSTGYPIPGSGTEKAFLQDTTTAPYVDFVSAHHYGNGSPNGWLGWEFGNEQAASYRNFANDVYGYIHAGLQPNASSTPFWINEYDSGVGDDRTDFCRYAPCNGLFQGIFIADQLAQAYNSNHGIARTWMWNLNNVRLLAPGVYESHCIFGASSCGNSSYPAMPNYYAFKLINGTLTDGLDLSGSGGYVVQQYATGQPSDTVPAGWYNSSGNHFYLVNAGPNPYTITFVFKNTSYVTWTGAGSHLWDSVNAPTTITNQSITMTKSNVSDWTTSAITLPPQSILGIGFRGQ